MPADPMPGAGDVALIQYSSGSTRQPRGVVLSHRNLVANIKGIIDLFALDRDSRGLLWLPPPRHGVDRRHPYPVVPGACRSG